MIRTAVACLIAAVVAAAACADTTPILVEEAVTDAALAPAPDSAVANACRHCIEDEGMPCRGSYDLCVPLPGCLEFYECAFALGCFALPLFEERLLCGDPCIRKANLTSESPSLPGILALNVCTQQDCRAECIVE